MNKIFHFLKKGSLILEILLVIIITIPSFLSLLNNQYFSMHDDQHIARLFLLDQGIKQGYLYPRWVDTLGFGYGYPLFNFYPPLVYYVAEIFHLFGFSLIWSVKLTFILGFFLAALGIYIFMKKIAGKLAGFLSATLYTYFFYHAVVSYVRGALAEFFAMAIFPFIFLSLENLRLKTNVKNSLLFGLTFAFLILTHPLIASPAMFFIVFFLLFYILIIKDKFTFFKYFILGLTIGLSLSSFFWLPSLMEKRYTLVDNILIKELANYKIHYIYPQQFLYSLWGYGGSISGPYDGMTFQLGKIHILLSFFSLILGLVYCFKTKKIDFPTLYFLFSIFLLLFSLFMTTQFSSFIWDKVKYLWYLQFPWRFLTFAGFLISVVGGYSILFLEKILYSLKPQRLKSGAGKPRGLKFEMVLTILVFTFSLSTILIYQKYFKPQRLLLATDQQLTTDEEIAWRVSRTSFEFVSKGVKTTKSDLNTTILDIKKADLPKKPYEIVSGRAEVKIIQNKFSDKKFLIKASSPSVFRLNTYNFPGWNTYLDNKPTSINDNNSFKLITVNVPHGNHKLAFSFRNTAVRKIADLVSIIGWFVVFILFLHLKEKDGRFITRLDKFVN